MVLNYADQGNEHYHYNGGFMREKRETEDTDFMKNAIQQGMKKRKLVENQKENNNPENYNSNYTSKQLQLDVANLLCSIAGDISITELPLSQRRDTNNGNYPTTYVLGHSEFATACILHPNLNYYEIVLETCGLSQIGFADVSSSSDFTPNTDTGDGVGDDAYSYSYDAS